MRALTLWQPWATLVALGVKTIETRSWGTSYRGPLLIHAARRLPTVGEFVGDWCVVYGGRAEVFAPRVETIDGRTAPLPLGAVVGVVDLAGVVPMLRDGEGDLTIHGEAPHLCIVADEARSLVLYRDEGGAGDPVTAQRPYGVFAPGRHAFLLDDARAVESPVTAKGRQGLWRPHAGLVATVEARFQ